MSAVLLWHDKDFRDVCMFVALIKVEEEKVGIINITLNHFLHLSVSETLFGNSEEEKKTFLCKVLHFIALQTSMRYGSLFL